MEKMDGDMKRWWKTKKGEEKKDKEEVKGKVRIGIRKGEGKIIGLKRDWEREGRGKLYQGNLFIIFNYSVCYPSLQKNRIKLNTHENMSAVRLVSYVYL